jgi:hypothetical protein
LANGLSAVHPTHAQSSCSDPFAESGTPAFPTSDWTKTDFCKHSVSYAEIRSGGPPPDGIPPIDHPQFEAIKEASTWLHKQSSVIALEIDGDARAYPLAILIWHEIANDTVGGVPVAVTFCPLCNSSIVFDRRVSGTTLRFGVSGNLRNSDLIMWDDVTQSWWQQFTGEAIVGSYTGAKLTYVSSQVVGFTDFAARFPKGRVLSRQTGYTRSYGKNPYSGYDSNPRPFLFDGTPDKRLPAMSHVLGAWVAGQAVAYPFDVLSKQRVINDTVTGVAVVAVWQPGVVSALDAASIDQSRDIGTAALYDRTLDRQVLTFRIDEQGIIRDEQTSSGWDVFGHSTDGKMANQQLKREISGPYFWFAWAAFRPETSVYGPRN